MLAAGTASISAIESVTGTTGTDVVRMLGAGSTAVSAVESVLGGSTYVDPRLPISAVDVASPPAG